jgi:peptidoglycan/xylan/chitin deacetylase (PgdA/CDA1 family)
MDYGPFPYVPINRRSKWKWPNGAQLAVWVIPNLEFFSLKTPLAGHPFEKAHEYKPPTVRAWGQRDYGNRVGVFRMMDVLSKHGIRATATTNTDICEYHPQIIEDAVKLGWEFMGHNKTNTTRLTALAAGEERELIRYCTRRLQQATGKRPVGWLGSGLAETWDTVDYLSENEYLYVSDWVNDDQPYRMKVASGKELVYLPYSYEVNDSNQINYRFQTAEDFGTIIRNTFDVLYEEGADSARVMAICLHPFMTGVPHRIRALDNALKYIKGHDDVWFATGEEIVRAYLASDASI